mmetsp:Transcript_20375/g.40351  ORF Transcript_20375/g.40351 Transcript_20375/m.40351 type:complete len:468 (-) Transcript_20375:925-2328(-)
MVKGFTVDADAGWTPLILSTIAGMSTCVGALIVFCHPIDDEVEGHELRVTITPGDSESISTISDRSTETKSLLGKNLHLRMSGKRKVSPSTMAFSLALAGSVMITVSVVSIGPECLAASSMPENNGNGELAENSFFVFGITLMPILSWAFLQRLLSFGAGCLLYFLMSKYAFPEPEEILSEHSEALLSAVPRGIEPSASEEDDDDTMQRSHKTVPSCGRSKRLTLRKNGSQDDLELKIRNTGGKQESSSVRNKGVSRRPPNDRIQCCIRPLTSCMSFLRTFSTGSDLQTAEARRANRVAMLLFVSLLIHNFPEGLAVAASSLESDQLGLTVTVGIMIHNIPEGIAIAIPCLKARPDSPFLCFLLASVSGLAEPAGAFVSLVILRGFERRKIASDGISPDGDGFVESDAFPLENVLAFVAGIMITVSFLELLPEGKYHAKKSTSMNAYYAGLVAGFVVMVATEFGMSL